MNIKQTASQIIDAVGGKNNMKEMFHCVTRLRFYLKDSSVVDIEKIKRIEGVLGVQYQTDQLQIIIGHDVEDVYQAITNKIGFVHSEETLEQKKKFQFSGIFETLAAIFLPAIPILAGTGMIKGLITIMTMFLGFDAVSDAIVVMTIIGDCAFYFFPIILAWSASKRFKTDTAVAIALGAALLYPTMTTGLAEGASPLHFLGLPIPFVKYAASSIPIILTVWVQSYVYKFIDKLIPKALKLVFTPMIVMLIMVPLMLIGIAPLASYVSQGLAAFVRFLFTLSPIIAGAVVGGTRSLVVLTGMHLSLGAICMENLASVGRDVLLPINTMGTLAIVGVCLGTWYKSKNTETKSIAFSAFVSSFIGITEPGIYGVLLKFKNALLSVCIAGAVGGAFVAFFGGTASAYVNSCILSLPVFIGDGFWAVCVGMLISFVLGFTLIQIFGLSEEKNVSTKTNEKEDKFNNVVFSPLSGEIIQLEQIEDTVFSTGQMGKGIAIKPNDKNVIAPFDGIIKTVFPTKHALGIVSKSGVECLIHLGMDTVNLNGKYFDVLVKEGDSVSKGEIIAKVDFEAIATEGYSIVTPIIVTNSNIYLDVLPNELSGLILQEEILLTIIE